MYVRSGALIDRVDSLLCKGYAPWGGLSGSNVSVPVGVGGAGGVQQVLYCPSSEVGGVFTRSGWLLDGFGLRCR